MNLHFSWKFIPCLKYCLKKCEDNSSIVGMTFMLNTVLRNVAQRQNVTLIIFFFFFFRASLHCHLHKTLQGTKPLVIFVMDRANSR